MAKRGRPKGSKNKKVKTVKVKATQVAETYSDEPVDRDESKTAE
jgi:hypothetical protein